MVGGKDEETHSKGDDHDQDDADHEWSFEENKTFENAIAQWMSKDSGSSEDLMMMIQQMASKIPGKTVRQIRHHLKALCGDIEMIEKGLIPIPNYVDPSRIDTNKPTSNTVRRRRGIPWTKQEHELFLEGLVKYGKGDWRSISRLCVVTRTPTQVASHAQKHFLRCENTNKKIHKKMANKYSSSPSPSPADHHHHHHVSQGQGHAILINAASSSPPPPPCPSCQRPFSF